MLASEPAFTILLDWQIPHCDVANSDRMPSVQDNLFPCSCVLLLEMCYHGNECDDDKYLHHVFSKDITYYSCSKIVYYICIQNKASHDSKAFLKFWYIYLQVFYLIFWMNFGWNSIIVFIIFLVVLYYLHFTITDQFYSTP